MFSAATKQFIVRHRHDDVRHLALSAKTSREPDVDLPAAIIQIAGRQIIKDKLPSWHETDDLVYPQKLSLEQCSSEKTAHYKASLVAGDSFVDLTGGFGVDCAYISRDFREAVYVEQQPDLCDIARHNFPLLQLKHISVVNDQAEHYLECMKKPVDCIYLDPARRSEKGKKVVAISNCEPDINRIKELLWEKTGCILIKLSPLLDIRFALQSLPETSDIHVVSVENECKELLFLLKKGWNEEPSIHCVNFIRNNAQSSFVFKKTKEKETLAEYTSEVGKFLYEPNASLLKAGAYKLIASHYQLQKLHPDSHLYTTSQLIADFPGRCFEVQAVSSFNKTELRTKLETIKQANLSIRNFPLTVDELKKKLRLKDGGNKYLFATTLNNGKRILIRGELKTKTEEYTEL